jgi:hypothetical protein
VVRYLCGPGFGFWEFFMFRFLSLLPATGAVTSLRLGLLLLGMLALIPLDVLAHAVTEGDKGYIQEISGVNLVPFTYLGAKHMVTGYDHILFLFGVIFYLYRLKDVGLYVSLFAIGHSTTMLLGVYFDIGISSFAIDAIIGLSVVYKALDNMGAFQRWLGFQPNPVLPPSSLVSAMDLVWQPRSRSTTCLVRGWCPICWRSTLGWNWASYWPWVPS